jgi:hypothetical protein
MDVTLIIALLLVDVFADLMSEMLLSKIAFSKISILFPSKELKGQTLPAQILEINRRK